jgi:DNA-binding transcriptional LysR family regulator
MSLPISLVYPSRRTPQRVSALMDFIAREIRQSHPPV